MAIKILVPLRKHDRLEEIVPYMEEMAEPGASVVFLIRHPVSDFKLARQKVFSACEALHRLGVTVTVDIYAGSLSKALSNYASHENVQLVVMQPGIGQRIASYLQGVISIQSIFRHPFSSSIFIRPSA